jgi:MYXO-CTERM domain-containing protein
MAQLLSSRPPKFGPSFVGQFGTSRAIVGNIGRFTPGGSRRMESMHMHRFGGLRASGMAVLAGAATLIAASAAAAQECAKDADCGDGYVCKSYDNQVCATDAAKPCPPDDKTCIEMQQKATPPTCTTQTSHVCEPKPCNTDSDCGAATLVCYAQTTATCSGGGPVPNCKPGADCPTPAPTPPDCTTTTTKTCTPRWQVPCKHDADCGDGFNCKEVIVMACSGSAGTGTGIATPGSAGGSSGAAVDGGAAEPPPPPPVPPMEMCTSTPTGQYACELKQLPCDTDADCPSGLKCQDAYAGVTCISPGVPAAAPHTGGSSGSAGAGAPEDAGVAAVDAGQPTDPCAQFKANTQKMCAPPDYYARDKGALGAGNASGVPEAASTGGNTQNGSSKDGSATPPAAAGPSSGAGHSVADAGSGSEPIRTNHGCAVSAGDAGSSGVLGFLGMLGLSVLALRRRR